jgi:hypothetical protein
MTDEVRLGKVRLTHVEYVVDLNNEDMVNHAKDALFEDIRNAVYHEEIWDGWIEVEEDKKGELKPEDIAEFLKPEENDNYGKDAVEPELQ